MITIEYAKKRLAEIAELTDGWEFGEGIAPSRTSLERAEQVLDFAHKVGIQEMEVFPRADGAVEVHLYNDPWTLEVTCWTDALHRHWLIGRMKSPASRTKWNSEAEH